ncbi:MAG: S1/P1 nuclease [Nitratireductor sp.]
MFADEHRVSHTETSRWHYVDIPYDKDSYDPQRDCAVEIEGDCIIEAISRELARIRDPEARVFDRADALKRLIHWVGDIHQPFHTIERDGDQGGNKVTVTFFGEARKNLRSGQRLDQPNWAKRRRLHKSLAPTLSQESRAWRQHQ